MNLYQQLCACEPSPRIKTRDGDRISDILPFVGGATGKKIEELRVILMSMESKEEIIWNQILREWGPS
jgi:hypothetical protein